MPALAPSFLILSPLHLSPTSTRPRCCPFLPHFISLRSANRLYHHRTCLLPFSCRFALICNRYHTLSFQSRNGLGASVILSQVFLTSACPDRGHPAADDRPLLCQTRAACPCPDPGPGRPRTSWTNLDPDRPSSSCLPGPTRASTSLRDRRVETKSTERRPSVEKSALGRPVRTRGPWSVTADGRSCSLVEMEVTWSERVGARTREYRCAKGRQRMTRDPEW